MDPEARERLAGRRFALRDLVLVMREDQIDAAGVDVDRRLAEQPQRHRRALEMPPGPAGRIDEVPGRLAVLGRLPQHEIARVLLGVVVGVDARARLHPVVIEPRQASVAGQRRDLEVDRAVAPVGVAVRDRAPSTRSAIARRFASSVARGISSTSSRPSARASSRNAAMY